MFKSNGGFTLVELIVVIAILAILAGVAVPAYTGYIEKANNTACLAELSAIQTAAQAACAMEGSSVSAIAISGGKVTVTAKTEGVTISDAEFAAFYENPSNLDALIKKHEKGSTGAANWAPTTGWDLLAD